MFNHINQTEIDQTVQNVDHRQLTNMLSGAPGFPKFLLYSNIFNEGLIRIKGLIDNSDLDDDITLLIFKKAMQGIFDKGYELIFHLMGDQYIDSVIQEQMNWSPEFMEKAEKLYLKSEKELAHNPEMASYFEHRMISDVLSQNITNFYLKKLMMTNKLKDIFSNALRKKIEKIINDKFEINYAQYVFLCLFLKMSTDPSKQTQILKFVNNLQKNNKNFFSKEHIIVFQNLEEDLRQNLKM